jgi:hypothetical protein
MDRASSINLPLTKGILAQRVCGNKTIQVKNVCLHDGFSLPIFHNIWNNS